MKHQRKMIRAGHINCMCVLILLPPYTQYNRYIAWRRALKLAAWRN